MANINDIINGTTVVNQNAGNNSVFTSSDPNQAAQQLRSAGLPAGAEFNISSTPASSQFATKAGETDWRVRITCDLLQNLGGVLSPLNGTSGLIFPYLPTVTISHSANYSPLGITHNNYPFYAYNNSQVDDIQVTGDFSVQDQKEALYWLAAVHFLRSATKMYFGQGPNLGNPPPICKFNGYGDFVFKDVPVIIKNFSVELPKEVDYIATDSSQSGSSGITYVPTLSTISVTMSPIYSRQKIKSFNLSEFASGKLVLGSDGKGFI